MGLKFIGVMSSEGTPMLPTDKTCVYTNWGRGALEAIIKSEKLQNTSVMLPAFICQKSLDPLFRRYDITPVFVDVDRETFQLKYLQAKDYIEKVAAVVLVHPFGYPVEMGPWIDLCEDNGVVLIEDCVRALGAGSDGTPVGTAGDHAIYSLPKVSSFEKGGILATSMSNPETFLESPTYGGRALYHLLPTWLRNELSVTYPLDVVGRKLDDITRQAFERAIQTEFTKRLEENQRKATMLKAELETYGVEFQPQRDGQVHYSTPVTVSTDRDKVYHYLLAHDVAVKIIWANPWSKTVSGERFGDWYPNTKAIADSVLVFDVDTMSLEDVRVACHYFKTFIETHEQ